MVGYFRSFNSWMQWLDAMVNAMIDAMIDTMIDRND